MPKAKLPKSRLSFTVHRHPLSSDDAKVELLALLDPDSDPLILRENVKRFPPTTCDDDPFTVPETFIVYKIEMALGIYAYWKQYDNAPRPADYVREFESLESKARELSDDLSRMNPFYIGKLSHLGADCDRIVVELEKLAAVSLRARLSFAGKSSQGRGKRTALLRTILRLRSIFRGHFCDKQGLTRGQRNRREKKFVKIALDDAAIKYLKLDRLMGDLRCTPS